MTTEASAVKNTKRNLFTQDQTLQIRQAGSGNPDPTLLILQAETCKHKSGIRQISKTKKETRMWKKNLRPV
jgi:hypothetical protein